MRRVLSLRGVEGGEDPPAASSLDLWRSACFELERVLNDIGGPAAGVEGVSADEWCGVEDAVGAAAEAEAE